VARNQREKQRLLTISCIAKPTSRLSCTWLRKIHTLVRAAFVIPELEIMQILPETGDTVVYIPAQASRKNDGIHVLDGHVHGRVPV